MTPEEERELNRRRARRRPDVASEGVEGLVDAVDLVPRGSGGGAGSGCGSCDGCGGCDCSPSLLLFRLSTLLYVASLLVPEVGSGWLVQAAIRGYRWGPTRFTAPCPSTPSCSAFAFAAVETLGPRRGLAAAALRVRSCAEPRRPREPARMSP